MKFRECIEIIGRGGSIEVALKCIRDRGGDKIDCIKALVEGNKYTSKQAKIIVHYSQTWRDRRSDDETFHKSLIASLQGGGLRIREQADKDKAEVIEAFRVLGIDIEGNQGNQGR